MAPKTRKPVRRTVRPANPGWDLSHEDTTDPEIRVRSAPLSVAPSTVQSVSRAMAILNAVADRDGDPGATLSDIAQIVGLPPSTTHRLLTTLQQGRYVRFDHERLLWSVGVQAFLVGNAFVRDRQLVQIARIPLRALMEESGETVNLAIENDGEAVFLYQVECRQMMRTFSTLGSRLPLHCSGVGKAMLSAMPEGRLSRILHRRSMPRLTSRTLVRAAELRSSLALARQQGFAIDDEEHAVGLRCVAAPIYDESADPIAAISISGPAARITDDRIAILGDMVRRVANGITRDFGGHLP
ncbi:MAG: IclR family transcriptional regulator C-terminal domain-containing protein [Azospirillaceae bacterium]|nr:IclR family transcriptional regulator C-terminal domain-containing protein [Azospirillaceae bacterium]